MCELICSRMLEVWMLPVFDACTQSVIWKYWDIQSGAWSCVLARYYYRSRVVDKYHVYQSQLCWIRQDDIDMTNYW